jgi:hypothetical protein
MIVFKKNNRCNIKMEYATHITNDDNYIKYVGYNQSSCIKEFYSKHNVDKISQKITELLEGVDKNNRSILVPDKTIYSVMNSVCDNFMPETGDIYTRYNIASSSPVNDIQRMIDETINIITTDVKVNLGMDECNSKLSIWTTILGDFNKHGLRSHGPIKLKMNRGKQMAFNMNY